MVSIKTIVGTNDLTKLESIFKHPHSRIEFLGYTKFGDLIFLFFPGGAKTLVSQGGGIEVRWGPDGRTLYYEGQVKGTPMMIEATVRTSPDFAVVRRTPLFDASDFEPAQPHANWDLSPDGTRFAMAHQAPLNTLAVVLGWTEEVRRHASAARP